jgi:homoserine kinase type II
MQPIGSGIENTNYFVTTPEGEWVMTLFERLSHDQLPFYLRLMQHLAQRGLPVPEPRADAQGELVQTVAGKPAALVNRLQGEPGRAGPAPLPRTGRRAGPHAPAVADFPLQQPNLRGLPWREATAPVVRPTWPRPMPLLDQEMAHQRELHASAAYQGLPSGAVHADLFRDNAMFAGLPGRELPERVVRLLLRRHRHLRVRPGGGAQRLVHRPGQRPAGPAARRGPDGAYQAERPLSAPSCACCPPCAAPRRCASGSRACPTGTCRARPACSSPRTRPTSNACCATPPSALARRRLTAWR